MQFFFDKTIEAWKNSDLHNLACSLSRKQIPNYKQKQRIWFVTVSWKHRKKEKYLKMLKRLWINGSCDGSWDVNLCTKCGQISCGNSEAARPSHRLEPWAGVDLKWWMHFETSTCSASHCIIQVLAGVVVAACIMASWPWWFPGRQRSTETEQCTICRKLADINDIEFNHVQSNFI